MALRWLRLSPAPHALPRAQPSCPHRQELGAERGQRAHSAPLGEISAPPGEISAPKMQHKYGFVHQKTPRSQVFSPRSALAECALFSLLSPLNSDGFCLPARQRLSQLPTGGESDCSHPSSLALMGIESKEMRGVSPGPWRELGRSSEVMHGTNPVSSEGIPGCAGALGAAEAGAGPAKRSCSSARV